MKVLVLCHRLPYPADNGAKMRMFHLMRQLAHQHDVAVLYPESPAPAIEALRTQLGSDVRVAPAPWPTLDGWRSAAAFLSPLPRDVHRAAPDSAASRLVDEWVSTWAPDVIFATDQVLGEYLRPYPGLARVLDAAAEYVLYLGRATSLQPAMARPLWWLRALKWAAYTRALDGPVDLWVVPSPVDRQALLRHLRADARVAVVPNGVDLEAIPFRPNADALPQLASCAMLSYHPNRDALQHFCRDIWPLVRRRVPEARLIVTGDSASLPEEVRRAPGLILTGYLPEVRSVLHACRATVVPLRLGVGTRLKILESMAVGAPVVSTSVGAEGLDVTDGEDILLADEPAAFADRVVQVLGSREIRARLSLEGRKLVEERYAWDVIGGVLRGTLESLVAQSPRAGDRGPGRAPLVVGPRGRGQRLKERSRPESEALAQHQASWDSVPFWPAKIAQGSSKERT